ncbi:MAG: HIT domain-containing protein, partial [Bacteroidetes bacterium]|nr:HIT domain-containing protein [Bacteroidota bacterium]
NPHLTAKERDRASFPTRKLWRMEKIRGRVLDFGCGFGADVDFLRSKGLDVTGYDPHYRPDYPEGRFDTILCHYVLNVLLPEVQSQVLMEVSELLKPDGTAYFTVRRDLRRPGYRMHKKHRKRTYQCNVVLPYQTTLKTKFCEIYRYQHYTHVAGRVASPCPFCSPDSDRELLTESARAFAIFDKYPVSEGHALIIPKVHNSDYFDLDDRTQASCWMLANRVREILRERFSPDGFNVGINIGESSGQTVDHVHLHLIPRYAGDVENPRGGVRAVIPGKADYTK